MNNLEYLNQISQDTRPVKKKSSSFTSLMLKIIIGGLLALVLIIALGILLGSGKSTSADLTKQLYFRTTSLNDTVSDFNSSLKSSKLRAIGTSLSNTLTSASGQLSTYLTAENPKAKDLNPPASILTSEVDNINSFTTSLTNAKLNGILDRIYANEIQFQVSILLSLIAQTTDHTKNPDLLTILSQYYSSLENIDQSLASYSNPNT